MLLPLLGEQSERGTNLPRIRRCHILWRAAHMKA